MRGGGVYIQYISLVYGNNAMLLRRNVWSHSLLSGRLKNYTRLAVLRRSKD